MAGDSNVVYGITITSRGDRSELNGAVSVARTLYESGAHGLVDGIFFDPKIGHLFLDEKPGISDEDRGRICDALARLDGSSALVEYEGDYYPDPNVVREGELAYKAHPSDLDDAPPWARRLLEEVQSLRAEVAALRPVAPRDAAADEIGQIQDPDGHPRPQAPTYPRALAVPNEPPHGR